MNQHSPLYVWQAEQQTWQPQPDWQQVRDTYGAQSICLYFPSRHALQVSSELSNAQLKQLGETGKQYLFEETSLTPVEQLNVRDIRSGSSHYLYAVAQSDLYAWQQSAALVGLDIVALLPDFLLLPIPDEGVGQQIMLYQDEQTSLIRQSVAQGMAVGYLPIALEHLVHLNEVCVLTPIANSLASKQAHHQHSHQDQQDYHDYQVIQDIITQIRQDIVVTPISTPPIPVQAAERHALNFLVKTSQVNFSPYLQVTMMVALAALVLQLATDGLQWYQYQQANTATEQAISEQYNAWFPNDPRAERLDLRVQINPKLATDAQTEAEYMAVLTRISPLIKQSSLVAQSLTIEPTALSFTLIGDSRDSLDAFASSLVAQGINASLGSVSSSVNNAGAANNNTQDKFVGQVTVNLAPTSS